ncbi:MAG: acyltransferase family protein [Candidatus Xenolissoclinum pacificiensis L6]|uniref:Acyltransferase family protein n=1 Tax=Candidatus Xenolissoclinum pacificiensis L6 TaxID=1401685 RepID=W2V0L9_9RICK|nr:MAG: acyltransferase family protein [Candidatus Xenolissoclinum pacificiensis L6]
MVENEHYLRDDNQYIVACKHSSCMDVALMYKMVKNRVFLYKRELLFVPIAGLGLPKIRSIPVARDNISLVDMKKIIQKCRERVRKNDNIVVFPEGTRKEVAQYKPGVFFIYKAIGIPVIPIALNTKQAWSRGLFAPKKKYVDQVTIRILPPILPGMKRKEFMEELRNSIEDNTQEIISNEEKKRCISRS